MADLLLVYANGRIPVVPIFVIEFGSVCAFIPDLSNDEVLLRFAINLQDLNTLRRIIDYVVEKTGGEAPSEALAQKKAEVKEEAPVVEEKAPGEPKTALAGRWEMVRDKVVEIVAEKTGYPEDMLELDLDL